MPKPSDNTVHGSHLLCAPGKIAPVLEALAAKHQAVTAELPDGKTIFATQLVHSDPAAQFIIVAGADAALNAAVLALARLTFVAEPDDWHIEFVGAEPSAIEHEGLAAIRLAFPEILTVQQRRKHERRDLFPVMVLHCLADAGGFAPFEAQIKDLSLGGLSVLIYPPDVTIEPGTVLVGSRIEMPGADVVTVDLEVRYSEMVNLEDGSRARCSGFRFINAPDEIKKLIESVDTE